MVAAYYVIVYESENIFSYNKLATVLYANDWLEVNRYLSENLDRFRDGAFDCFWERLGKKVGVELVYDDEQNVTKECYDEICEKRDKNIDYVGLMNCMAPKKSKFVLETMIVSQDNVLFAILQELECLRVSHEENEEKEVEKKVEKKTWWFW